MLRYGRSSPGPYLGMEFLRMSRWRSAQKRRCGSRCYVQRGHGKVINQDGWYTFHVVNRYTFKCRLTLVKAPRSDDDDLRRCAGGSLMKICYRTYEPEH